jgi:hypothetical protein
VIFAQQAQRERRIPAWEDAALWGLMYDLF